MQHFSRPLDHNQAVVIFLQLSLQLDYKKVPQHRKIIPHIVDGELGVSRFNVDSQTLSVVSMRHTDYRNENDRWDLRDKIINELWTKKRFVKDDKIELGKGGALPRLIDKKYEAEAFILIGLPAS